MANNATGIPQIVRLESLSQAIGSQMAQVGAEAAALAITQVERIDRTAHAGKERLVARAP